MLIEFKDTQKKLFWPQLDGLRTMAFLLVLISHLSSIPISKDTHPMIGLFVESLNRSMGWGWTGVQLFFLLSGYLITILLLEERKKSGKISFFAFFIRRTLRIWPLYYLLLFINFILMPSIFHNGHLGLGNPHWWNMVDAFFLPFFVFFGNFALATHHNVEVALSIVILWSICAEEQFYIIWGTVLSRIKSISILWWLILATIPLTLLIRVWCFSKSDWFGDYYFNTFAQLDPFLIGSIIAILKSQNKLCSPLLSKAGPLFFWLPIAYYIWVSTWAPNVEQHHISIVGIYLTNSLFFGLFLIALLVWKPAIQWFSNPLLAKPGKLTYGMYLFHVLSISLVQTFLPTWMRSIQNTFFWLVTSLIIVSITFLLSLFSWHLLEKKCLALRKRFVKIPSGSY